MQFIQLENGKVQIRLTVKERLTFFLKGKITLTQLGSRHFGNHIVKMVVDWQGKFKDNIKNTTTTESTPVETE